MSRLVPFSATESALLRRCAVIALAIVMVKVTIEVVMGYVAYLPPDFSDSFLLGRERYFFGSYRWAFYAHISVGPPTLVMGLLLLSSRFRRDYRGWHRRLGRIQVVLVLLVLVPSGFVMAFYARFGAPAAGSFVVLAGLTGGTLILGWKTAVQRQFAAHRRWMSRNFSLLSSAVLARLLGGLGTVLQIEASGYSVAVAWLSWLVPLVLVELWHVRSAGIAALRPTSARFVRRVSLQPGSHPPAAEVR